MQELIVFTKTYFGIFGIVLLLLIIYAVIWGILSILRPFLDRLLFKRKETAKRVKIRKRFAWPLAVVIWCLLVLTTESQMDLFFTEGDWKSFGYRLFTTIFILSLSFNIYRLIKVLFLVIHSNIDLKSSDNLRQRRLLTQLQFIEKLVFIVLAVVSVGLVLLQFESLAKFGGGVLASAGVASVVIGFAAQESVSNLIAGFQIAFTQPFRIDDAVVVEGEWGRIEEIALTYVVVKIWDQRRLVLPIKYFVTHPFQNWTRTESQILGAVEIYLDYRAPIEKIRQEFVRIVTSSERWDKEVQVLQVTDATEKTLKIRALMSAKDSGTAWDLRCEVREKLLDFIQKECPKALPQNRLLAEEGLELAEPSPKRL